MILSLLNQKDMIWQFFIKRYKANNDDYNSIMAQAIADRLAEAFAEYLHHIVRTELWGYSNNEDLSATGKYII